MFENSKYLAPRGLFGPDTFQREDFEYGIVRLIAGLFHINAQGHGRENKISEIKATGFAMSHNAK